MKEKLFLKSLLRDEFLKHGEGMSKKELPPMLFSEHHESHAASAFYPSPYDSAVVLCMDGVGEWATTSAWLGEGNNSLLCGKSPFLTRLGSCTQRSRITQDLRSIPVSTK